MPPRDGTHMQRHITRNAIMAAVATVSAGTTIPGGIAGAIVTKARGNKRVTALTFATTFAMRDARREVTEIAVDGAIVTIDFVRATVWGMRALAEAYDVFLKGTKTLD